jgi:hypothetical protein
MEKTLHHRHQWLFLLMAALLFLHTPCSLFAVPSTPAQPDRFAITITKVELKNGKGKYVPFANGPFVFETLLSDPTTLVATIPSGRPISGEEYTGARITFLGAFAVQWSLFSTDSFYYTDAHNDGVLYKTKTLKGIEAVTKRNLIAPIPSLVNIQVIPMPGGSYKQLLRTGNVEVLKKGLLRACVASPLVISGYGPQMLDIDLTNVAKVVYDDITVKGKGQGRLVRVLYPAVPSFAVSVRGGV